LHSQMWQRFSSSSTRSLTWRNRREWQQVGRLLTERETCRRQRTSSIALRARSCASVTSPDGPSRTRTLSTCQLAPLHVSHRGWPEFDIDAADLPHSGKNSTFGRRPNTGSPSWTMRSRERADRAPLCRLGGKERVPPRDERSTSGIRHSGFATTFTMKKKSKLSRSQQLR
jgi:hypothetical protein